MRRLSEKRFVKGHKLNVAKTFQTTFLERKIFCCLRGNKLHIFMF